MVTAQKPTKERIKKNAELVSQLLSNPGQGEFLNPYYRAVHGTSIPDVALRILSELQSGKMSRILSEEFSIFGFSDGSYFAGFFRSPVDKFYAQTAASSVYPQAVQLDEDVKAFFEL